jgi:hypothetical protein
MDEHIQSLSESLDSMKEDIELMRFFINRPDDRYRIESILCRYHADLKIYMKQINSDKKKILSCLSKEKPKT